jgi:cyclopropane-fatty-acyl-phospholipid synthase
LASLLGGDLPVAIRAYDGSHAGPSDASATLVIRSPDAVRRVLSSLGELGMARAYVAGDIEVDGDIFVVLAALGEQLVHGFRRPQSWGAVARLV